MQSDLENSKAKKTEKILEKDESIQIVEDDQVDPFENVPPEILDIMEEFETKAQEIVEDFGVKLNEIWSNNKPGTSIVKRKRNPIQKGAREYLKQWLEENKQNPYPSEEQKLELEKKTGLSRLQLDNWMVNGRKRYLSMKKTPPSVRGKLELKSLLETKFLESQDTESEESGEESEDSEPNEQ